MVSTISATIVRIIAVVRLVIPPSSRIVERMAVMAMAMRPSRFRVEPGVAAVALNAYTGTPRWGVIHPHYLTGKTVISHIIPL